MSKQAALLVIVLVVMAVAMGVMEWQILSLTWGEFILTPPKPPILSMSIPSSSSPVSPIASSSGIGSRGIPPVPSIPSAPPTLNK